MTCKSCQTWEFAAGDIYCSWCGATLVDASVAFDVAHVYTGADDLTLTLSVKHAGAVGTVSLGAVEARTPWVRLDPAGLAGKSLESGEEASLAVLVDTRGLSPDDYHQAEIIVQTSVGARSATLECVPKPKPQASLGEYTVLLDGLHDERLTGYLSLMRGVVTVTKISTDVPWACIELSDKVSLPHRLDARANLPLEFKLDIDEVNLLKAIEQGLESPPITHKAQLVVEYAELTPPREYPFYVKCFLPPLLKVPEAEEQNNVRVEVFTGRRAEVDLTLRNGEEGEGEGRAELQILNILVQHEKWLQPTAPLTYPINIQSGDYLHVTFAVQTDQISEGSHLNKITFLTNAPGEGRQKEYFVEAFVRQMPEYDGVVAIDFGTTNSCCAFLDKSTRHGLIPIDEPGSGKQTVASSTILYHDLFETGEKDYDIGERAYEISFDPSATFSAVRQVKKRLGSIEPYTIIFRKAPDKRASYLPSEVAADILRRILERAEGVLKRRITSCTISHPSRFSLRQIEDLKSALTACGVKKIKTIHEPVAAALDFIRRLDVAEGREQYNLLIYDFGGGTTDITLLRVRRVRHPTQKLTVITPKVLGATGNPLFGGENVTDIVMTLGHANCEQILRDKYPNATSLLIPFYAENFKNNERRRRLAQENRNKLRRWAELSKIAIATYGDDHTERLKERDRLTDKGIIDGVNVRQRMSALWVTDGSVDQIQLEAIVDNEIKKETFAHTGVVPKLGELDDMLRPAIAGIIDMAEEWAGNLGVKSPDVILLSGKSSALPIVKDLMGARFPQAKIEIAGELKECVVRGACQLSVKYPRAGVSVRLDHSALSATTSRLGIAVWEDGQGKFKEIIGAGVPIEVQGLKRAITDVSFERDSEIRLLENTGPGSELVINNQDNQHIKELKIFSLESKLSEWERAHDKHVSPEELEAAEIELEVTPDLAIRLIARVPGVEEPLEFKAEWV
jgi:hypothetical protein